MTKIVGHRGAKGLELENTVKGFKLATSLGIDAVEFDVLSTYDGKIVVCHDDFLKRLAGKNMFIGQMTYAELAEIHLINGETIPLLYDVLALVSDTSVVIDIKTTRSIPTIFAIINQYPDIDFTIVTWHRRIIPECKRLRPDIPVLVERFFAPGLLLHSIYKHGADGLNLRHFWLNPLIYRATMRRGFKIQVYTINKVWHAKLIKKLYPDVWIVSNYPDRLMAAFDK